MTPRVGLISYDGLPISGGGGHGMGRLDTEKAWLATTDFLRTCTTTVIPRTVTLALNSTEGSDPGLIDRLRESAVVALGLHPSPHDRRDYGGVQGTSLMWHVPPEDAAVAVAWRQSQGRLPDNWLGGSALLSLDFKCRLRCPDNDEELPFQDASSYLGLQYDGHGTSLGESRCRLTLSSRNTLSLVLFLPFESPHEELWHYVAFLQARLPFSFSSKHWKHWRLTKAGTSYVGRKIVPVFPSPGSAG